MTLAPGTLFTPNGGILDLKDTYSGNWIQDGLMVMMGPVDHEDDDDVEIIQGVHTLTHPWHYQNGADGVDDDVYITATAYKKIEKMNALAWEEKQHTEGFIKLSEQVAENQRVSWVLIGGQNRPAILVHWNGEKCVKYGQSRRAGRVCVSNN